MKIFLAIFKGKSAKENLKIFFPLCHNVFIYHSFLKDSLTIEFTLESSYLSAAEKSYTSIEMPGQAETTVDNSCQTVGNETVVGSETIVGNDSDPDVGSLHIPSILPKDRAWNDILTYI